MAKILIVEDSPPSLRLAVAMLGQVGHCALEAANAEDAIALARRERPDLILMDIQLPAMNGLEATRILKADPATADIPIVALTAYALPGDRERILAGGCDDYLAKPVHYEELMEHVRRWLEKKAP